MSLIKITFDSASVTSKQDADINHFLANNQNGIFSSLLGGCVASTSNNYISFQSGYIQVYGRRIFVEAGTRIGISLDTSAYGYIIIKINLGDNSVNLEKKEATENYPTLLQEDLRNGGMIYEFPLTRYTKTTSSLTLDSTFNPPQISTSYSLANSLSYDVKNRVDNQYGSQWDGWATLSYGKCYIFRNLTTSNASRGIGVVYVGGCNVLFSTDAVSGSGGMVYYYYNGKERHLSMQLTSNGLYVEQSEGSEPKYARVIR